MRDDASEVHLCAFAVFEYALVNMLFRIEARVEKAETKPRPSAASKA